MKADGTRDAHASNGRLAGRLLVLLLLLLALAEAAGAGESEPAKQPSRFRGSDGGFDTSAFLASRGGFLPNPIIVTEPAVGYGGGLAAIFFHGGNPLQPGNQKGAKLVPPSITAAGVFATENGSKGAGLAHFGVWRGDRIRYLGAVAGASLELEYWGAASRPRAEPLAYGIDGTIVFQRLLFRIGESPLMVGGEWSWSKQKAEFESPALPPDAPPRRIEQNDSGAGVVAEYETLDNIFTPARGFKARVVGKVFSESIGGDNDRQTLDAQAFGYIPLHDRLVLGLRGSLASSDGDTPFYLRPFLSLRGLPAMKYSGKHAALGELEARWKVRGRWSAIAFGGAGSAAGSLDDLGRDRVGTYGGGFRYLIAEKLGLHAGVDYGRGGGDGAVYLVFGSAWR